MSTVPLFYFRIFATLFIGIFSVICMSTLSQRYQITQTDSILLAAIQLKSVVLPFFIHILFNFYLYHLFAFCPAHLVSCIVLMQFWWCLKIKTSNSVDRTVAIISLCLSGAARNVKNKNFVLLHQKGKLCLFAAWNWNVEKHLACVR